MDDLYDSIQWLYRFVDVLHTDRVHIYEYQFRVIKETPCGFWIDMFSDKKKWVSKVAKKRFAYPTRLEASVNFIARKNRQIRILTGQIQRAEDALHYFPMDVKNMEVINATVEERSDS